MDAVFYNVTDLTTDQRHAIEGVLGQPLRDDQRVIVQLVAAETSKPMLESAVPRKGDVPDLPDWVTIFADLSDEEFAELQSVILDRADLSRSFDETRR